MHARDLAITQTQNEKKKQEEIINAKARKKEQGRKIKTVFFCALIILLWTGIVYGGFHYGSIHLQEMEDRFVTQIEGLLLENKQIEARITETIQAVHNDLELSNHEMMQIQSELNLIQEELALTGETITGTDQTRLSLQERMSELDNQLASLRTQLKRLEEAVRAF